MGKLASCQNTLCHVTRRSGGKLWPHIWIPLIGISYQRTNFHWAVSTNKEVSLIQPMLKPLVKRGLFLALKRGFLPLKWGRWTFLGISPPRNQLTTKTRFWAQRAPSQSLPVKVRSGNQKKKEKKRKKHAWVEHFTPPPNDPLYLHFSFCACWVGSPT